MCAMKPRRVPHRNSAVVAVVAGLKISPAISPPQRIWSWGAMQELCWERYVGWFYPKPLVMTNIAVENGNVP